MKLFIISKMFQKTGGQEQKPQIKSGWDNGMGGGAVTSNLGMA